jgi:YegS/Rv2252/BmrU family lipid kinase
VRPFLIVNPASASGRTGRHFEAIARAVRGAVGEFEARFTRARGDGSRLAREAADAGEGLVVAVGGDGTASEVVDGLLASARRESAFGFIPRGTGGDFRRALGIPGTVQGAVRALAQGRVAAIDLGRLEFTDHHGRPAVRHFANVASCGISAEVAARVNRSSKPLGGRIAFKLASVRALAGWRDVAVRWRVDGGPWSEGPVTALCVCNGRFFGGGMMVAPDARLDDGLLDVTIWSGFGLADFVLQQSKIYDGRHVQLPNTRRARGRLVEIEPAGPGPVLLEADGEQPGRLPARLSVVPGAIGLRGRAEAA